MEKEKWRGENWPLYKRKMLAQFDEKGFTAFALGMYPYDDDWVDEYKLMWFKIQGSIQRMILESLDESLSHLVVECHTGADMWFALCEYYDGSNDPDDPMKQQKILQFWSVLRNMKFRLGSDMAKHVNEMFVTRSRLQGLGEIIGNGEMITLMLDSLGPEFHSFVTTVRLSGVHYTPDTLKYAMIYEAEEMRRQNDGNFATLGLSGSTASSLPHGSSYAANYADAAPQAGGHGRGRGRARGWHSPRDRHGRGRGRSSVVSSDSSGSEWS